jgi:PAS domain S-box-containing protein
MEARVVLGVSAFVGLSLALVLTVTTRAVTSRSLERASSDLDAARTAFARLVANRAAFASAQTRLITALPVFRAHMSDVRLAADIATIDAMANDYRQQLKAQFCIVTDGAGRWLGSPGWPTGEKSPPSIRAGIDRAVRGLPDQAIVALPQQLFLVIFEPARFAEETLGTLTIGYTLDDGVAKELAELTRSEVNLTTASGAISGSSLPEAARGELRELISNTPLHDEQNGSPLVRRVGNVPYVAGTFPLSPDRASEDIGRLVLLQDWRPTQQFLDGLRRQLLLAGFGAFALALAGGVAFSRRMSRPLKDIARAAGEVAAGNWARQLPTHGSAEATTMATAFNEMTSHLRHWHEQAEERAKRLETSYERFQSVTESARDGIVSTNAQGAITFWNRSAATIFGYDEAQALGMSLEHLLAESDRSLHLEALAVGPDTPGGIFAQTIELTGVRKNGGRFPIELSLSTGLTADTSVTAVIRDVTERKRNEDALRESEAERRQSQKMEAIGLLAGGVAHDFNNLLMAIQGYGELVLMSLDPDHECRADIDEILKASNRAAALTRQLLAFSRRQVLAPQVLSLAQVLTGTEKLLRRLIAEDVQISSTIGPDLGWVMADPGQIEQVLVNLAVNARDAMPGGGQLNFALANVHLDDSQGAALGVTPGRYVRLEVSDTGCGMPPDVVSRIFEPFFTTKEEGRGTGLGLSTVYGIVQQSGGSIRVESRAGLGTTFQIDLPCCERQEAVARRAPAPVRSHAGSETVLLVEDDARVRALLATMLRRSGYTVLEAEGGEQGLEITLAHAGSIDLLLTDVVMPTMNGRVLAERLQVLSPGTRVLFMSGYSADATSRAGVQAADVALLQKPFSSATLAAKVREVLESAASRDMGSTPPKDSR